MLRPTLVVLGLFSLACGIPEALQGPEVGAAPDVAAPAAAPVATPAPALTVPPAAAAPVGNALAAPTYGYRLTLPSVFPAASTEKMDVPTAIGNISTELQTSCRADGTCIMVNGATYPEVAFTAQDLKTMLDGARDGALTNVGATKTSEQEIVINGFTGRDFQATASQAGMTFYIRSVIVVRKPHLIMVQWLGTDPNSRVSPEANAFFSSLVLDPV